MGDIVICMPLVLEVDITVNGRTLNIRANQYPLPPNKFALYCVKLSLVKTKSLQTRLERIYSIQGDNFKLPFLYVITQEIKSAF